MGARTASVSGGGSKIGAKSRIAYFDALRAFLPIAIITIHVFRIEGAWDVDSPRRIAATVINALMRFAVPIFVMISGALLLDPKKRFFVKKFFKKNVLKLIICYFVWAFFYAILNRYWRKLDGVRTTPTIFVSSLFGSFHLWFIMMLVAMYLLVPVLRKLVENRALMKYFLAIGFIFCFALPTVAEYADTILRATGAPDTEMTGFLIGIKGLFNDFSSWLGLRYVVYFVGGYYFATEDFSLKRRLSLYILGGLGAFSYVALSLLHGCIDGNAFDYGLQLMGLNVAVYSVAVFVAARYLLGRVKKIPMPISAMAKYSFGIYLLHAALIDWYGRIVSREDVSIMGMSVATVVIYILSFVGVWVISKIPLLKKVI